MANARQAVLRDRRTTTKRKVLRPGSLSSTADTIARKLANAQFESMVNRYNDGEVSNEEMYSFLANARNNPYFNEMDKVKIQDSLRDFQVEVDRERLEAKYKIASGQEKADVAEELVTFYKDRVNTLQSGTPAHSKAIQAVAEWADKGQKVLADMEAEKRKNERAKKEFELSQLPNNSDRLKQEMAAYQQFAQEAANDGDIIEASKWGVKANDIATTKLPAMVQKEASDEIDERLDLVKTNYERGAINAQEAAAELNEIDVKAQEYGLTSKFSQVDAFAEKLGMDVEKGTTIEEFEGHTFRIRTPGGGEYETNIKNMKAQFSKEDDIFRQAKVFIQQSGVGIVEQLGQLANLHDIYINGGVDSELGEFYGLINRKQAFETWANETPEKAYQYENNARDTLTKINSSAKDLQEYTIQLSGVIGDNPDLQKFIEKVTPLFTNAGLQPSMGSGEMGILVTTDKFGRQTEKVIPLNSQVQTTDAAGNIVVEDTYVGTNVAQVPGKNNVYVKLQPVYASEAMRAAGQPSFYQAEFEGQLWVKTLSDQEIMPAAQSTDRSVQEWYETQKGYEAELLANYQKINPPDIQPEMQPEAPLVEPPKPMSPEEKLGQELEPNMPLRPEGQEYSGISPSAGFGSFEFPYAGQSTFTSYTPTYEVAPYSPPSDIMDMIKYGNQLTQPIAPSLDFGSYKAPALEPTSIDYVNTPDITKLLPAPEQPKASGNVVTNALGSLYNTAKTGVTNTANKVKNWWDNLF